MVRIFFVVLLFAVVVLLISACSSGSDAEVAELEQQIADLEQQNAQLEARLEAISESTTATTTTTSSSTTEVQPESTSLTSTTTTTEATGGGDPVDSQASQFVGGTFSGQLPTGEVGELSVIAVGEDIDQSVPLIVRNMTDESIIRIEVNGLARDEGGSLLASGSSQGLNPNLVAPGEIAYGYVYFGFDTDMSRASTIEYTITAESAAGDFAQFENIQDLVPVEWARSGNNVLVVISNDTDSGVDGPIDASVACFDDAGLFYTVLRDFADGDSVRPGAAVSAQVGVSRTTCDVYLVAGNGFVD